MYTDENKLFTKAYKVQLHRLIAFNTAKGNPNQQHDLKDYSIEAHPTRGWRRNSIDSLEARLDHRKLHGL